MDSDLFFGRHSRRFDTSWGQRMESAHAMNGEKPPVSLPQFDIERLYENQKQRNNVRLAAYHDIIRRIHNRIDIAAKTTTTIRFQIPSFLFGHALYNYDECTAFIIQFLQSEGFIVDTATDTATTDTSESLYTLTICWRSDLIEKFVKENAPKRFVSSLLERRKQEEMRNEHYKQAHRTVAPPVSFPANNALSKAANNNSYHNTGRLFHS